MPTGGLVVNQDNENSKVNYTVIAPTTFHPFTVYQLSVTIHDPEHELTRPVPVRVNVEDAEDERNYISEHTVNVAPNTTEMITIHIDELPIERQYKLVVLGLSGIRFHKEANLLIQSRTYALLVQTDKAIYGAGDRIKFRVIVLDSLLKPANIHFNEQLDIFIADSHKNRVKQWTDVKTIKGVFSEEFQLDDAPNFGDWIITATVHGESVEKTVSIAKHALPKFEISIDSPNYFVVKDRRISALVRARYAYGKPMNGKAKVQLLTKHEEVLIDKDVEVENGKGLIEFDFESEIRPRTYDFCFGTYKIQASITEDLTGFSQTSTKSVTVHKDSYVIKMRSIENQYTADECFDTTVSVRSHDGSSVKVHENTKKITLVRKTSVITGDVGNYKEDTFKTMREYDLDENGNLQLSNTFTTNDHWVKYSAIYLGEEYYLNHFSLKNKDSLNTEKIQAEVLTSHPTIDHDVTIKVSSCETLTLYTYVLISRKKLIAAKTVSIPDNKKKTHTFSFAANNDMTPGVKVLIYVVKSDGIWSTKVNIDLRGDLHNFVDLSLSKALAQPGDLIDVNVKTNPKSYVGLLVMDERLLSLKSGNDIDGKEALKKMYNIFWKTYPYHQGHDDFLNYWSDFKHLDIILFTNVIPPPVNQKRRSSKRLSGPKHDVGHLKALDEQPMATLRKRFAETWIWDAIANDDFNGSWIVSKTVPNASTNWVVTAFAIDPETGFGASREPTILKVVKPVSVSLSLPHSVKLGEFLTIPCAVTNSSEHGSRVEVALEIEDSEFELVSASQTQDVEVKANDKRVVNFTVKPIKVGKIAIKVVAKMSTASDEVVQFLSVEAVGLIQYSTKSIFVDLLEKPRSEATPVTIDIPDGVVPDSVNVEVSCLGNVLGSCIQNFANLVERPCGCGEQNMVYFVPSLAVLNYLKNTSQLTSKAESKLKVALETGYQRQIKYRLNDGSFGVFGRTSVSGSTWLTAYVIKSFLQAVNHIYVESAVIDQGLEFLVKAQKGDGSFAENGNLFCRNLQGGSCKLALTAYVLTAFVEYKNDATKYQEVIDKAVKNISELIKVTNNTYSLAIAAYALQLIGHSSKDEALEILLKKAHYSDNLKWWADQYDSSSEIVQKTSYALLALLKAQRSVDILPIVRYLLIQSNQNGGFSGTQDTVLGIQALANFAETIANVDSNIEIAIKSNTENIEKRFNINKTNILAIQNICLPSTTKSVVLSASGKGVALFEVAIRYNVNKPDPRPDFRLDVKAKPLNEEVFELEFKTNYQPSNEAKDKGPSNLTILKAHLPSGYIVDTNVLEALQTADGAIKRVETTHDDTVAVIYFEHLSFKTITFKLNAFRLHDVSERKPALVVMYDSYDSDLTAHQFYSLP